jgi:hypothetical protein
VLTAVEHLDLALDTLTDFREVLNGQRDAWCNELEQHITAARDVTCGRSRDG